MGHIKKTHEWFEQKVKDYHGDKVQILSKYQGSKLPIDIVYRCELHGDTYKTLNAKNICKKCFLPCKECQSINKSNSARNNLKSDKQSYYKRLVDYCDQRNGQVLEKQWTKAKDTYHFKCSNPEHPVFESTADSLIGNKTWCPYCCGRKGDFQGRIEKMVKERGGELLSEYVKSDVRVTVKCKKHNYVWNMLPNNIKKGRWCPICSMGFNEKVAWDYFQNNSCNVKIQYSFDDLEGRNGEKLRFDFAIFNSDDVLVYLVEIDDEEHFERIFSNTFRQEQRQAALLRNEERNLYCNRNNIPLYRIKVPFNNRNKWNYDDYYNYLESELRFIVSLSKK